MIVLLDAGPLGLVTNPMASKEAEACNRWLDTMIDGGQSVLVPEIADYEVRRELIRANKKPGIRRLNDLREAIGYVPLDTKTMEAAASFWAEARNRGQQTADDKALDCDMILVAQAFCYPAAPNDPIVIATTNVRHLSIFADARRWDDISIP